MHIEVYPKLTSSTIRVFPKDCDLPNFNFWQNQSVWNSSEESDEVWYLLIDSSSLLHELFLAFSNQCRGMHFEPCPSYSLSWKVAD